ncbi:hypothetical protein [Amnibacterium sp.]|uniref:hypothetical protein n=1 Tax=Amnibacterium sp. TaxID=1872496 RepID=UPI003F7C2D60
MDPFRDPLLANACWICVVIGGALLALAIHDARMTDTRVLRRGAIALMAVGVVFGVADLYFTSQTLPSVW